MQFGSKDPGEQFVEILYFYEEEDVEFIFNTKDSTSMISFTVYNMRYHHHPTIPEVKDSVLVESDDIEKGKTLFEIKKSNISKIYEDSLASEDDLIWRKAGFEITCKDGTIIEINVLNQNIGKRPKLDA